MFNLIFHFPFFIIYTLQHLKLRFPTAAYPLIYKTSQYNNVAFEANKTKTNTLSNNRHLT